MNAIEQLKQQAREEVGYELQRTEQKLNYLHALVNLRNGSVVEAERNGFTQRAVEVCDSIEQELEVEGGSKSN